MGITGQGWLADLPLIIAFAILAGYTYVSGLRAPALISVVKDGLIYVTILVAIIVIPAHLGGMHSVFQTAAAAMAQRKTPVPIILPHAQYMAFGTLALGSALALFLYPHSATGVLSSQDGRVIQRNAALLPAYSLLLGFIALLGYMAVAAGIKTSATSLAVPLLFQKMFPGWFTGVAFAAIAIGALVPAAVMSIAAANLFTRNIYREYFQPRATPAAEARVAKLASLLVKLGALYFVVAVPQQFALNLQLLGGCWMLQVLPAVILGLYTRWLHRHALLVGWVGGMLTATAMVHSLNWKASIFVLHLGGQAVPGYAGLYGLIVNLALAAVLTPVFAALKIGEGRDVTAPRDYDADAVALGQ